MLDQLSPRDSKDVRASVILCAVLVILAGCNPYHSPQTIDPVREIQQSNECVDFGQYTLKIPKGWVADKLSRYDDEGRAQTVFLVRNDKRGRIAFLKYEVMTERPSWRGDVDVRDVSTARHEHVVFDAVSVQEPSGDDTPGNNTVHAYVKKDDLFLYAYGSFFTPVQPSLDDAVNYIDAITFGNQEADEEKDGM